MSSGQFNHYLPKKVDLKPRKHHGFTGLIILLGFFVPPLAVALRFGIGRDFFINVLCTLCGYIPGHGHNFYIQNIRNNTNRKRTPKWARKAGLVDETEENRKKAKSQWSGRYEERLPHSTLEDQDYAEDQIADVIANPTDTSGAGRAGNGAADGRDQRLWREDDEDYYNPDEPAPNQQRWHYPANFEGADAPHDRWGRTKAAHEASGRKTKKKPVPALVDDDEDIPEWGRDYGAPKRSTTSLSTSSTSRGSFSARRPRDPDGLDHEF